MKNRSNDRKEANLADVTGGFLDASFDMETNVLVNDGNQINKGDGNVSVGKGAQVSGSANINTGTQTKNRGTNQ